MRWFFGARTTHWCHALARHDPINQGGDFFGGPERAGNSPLHGRQALQVGGNCERVLPGEGGEIHIGHGWGQYPSIRPFAGRDGRHDLIVSPIAEAGFLVGRQIARHEGAQARNLESDIPASQHMRHVGLAQKSPSRVTVATAHDGNEIFAARDLIVGAGLHRDARR